MKALHTLKRCLLSTQKMGEDGCKIMLNNIREWLKIDTRPIQFFESPLFSFCNDGKSMEVCHSICFKFGINMHISKSWLERILIDSYQEQYNILMTKSWLPEIANEKRSISVMQKQLGFLHNKR